MGCDIHCYVEYRSPDRPDVGWRSFGGRINPGRDYHLFGHLAGVRVDVAPVAPPRGFPDDASYMANDDYWLWINHSSEASGSDLGVSWATAQQYAKYGAKTKGEFVPPVITVRNGEPCHIIENAEAAGRPTFVSHPDWHTHSWLTVEEYRQALERVGNVYPPYRALLAAMEYFVAAGLESRIVFWFDN